MKTFFLLAKLLLSVFLIYYIFTKIDYHFFTQNWNSPAGRWALILGISMMMLQSVMGAVRLHPVSNIFNYKPNFLSILRTCFVGAFFSQTMISFIGGDAMRVWCLVRLNIPTKIATNIILIDRFVGFIALGALCLLVMPFWLIILPSSIWQFFKTHAAFSIGGAMIGMSSVLLIITHFEKLIKFQFLAVLLSSKNLKAISKVLLLSSIIHMLNVIAIYYICHFYDININFIWCTILVIPIMLLSMLPISIAGWGLREAAMIYGFGLLGYSADQVLAVSISFGISLLIGSLPGVIIFLFEGKRRLIVLSEKSNSSRLMTDRIEGTSDA